MPYDGTEPARSRAAYSAAPEDDSAVLAESTREHDPTQCRRRSRTQESEGRPHPDPGSDAVGAGSNGRDG